MITHVRFAALLLAVLRSRCMILGLIAAVLLGITALGCGEEEGTSGAVEAERGWRECRWADPVYCDSDSDCLCGKTCVQQCRSCEPRCVYLCDTDQECIDLTNGYYNKCEGVCYQVPR
ncbi:MAG TPA: hypothetical protein VGQ83_16755 [Polyangia bacterium]|jgi:hypothetical protein